MYLFSCNCNLYVIIVTVHRSVKYEPILTAGVNGATLHSWLGKDVLGE